MTHRPLPVSAVCVVGAVAALITTILFSLNAPWAVQPTAGQRAVAFAAVAVTVAALYGMWRMRRWGVALLAAGLVVGLGYALLTHAPPRPSALTGPAIALAVGVLYWRRMS